MMAFSPRFDPTTLREYDIRGIVGRTLSEKDAFAIGRCLGTIVARDDGPSGARGVGGAAARPGAGRCSAPRPDGERNGGNAHWPWTNADALLRLREPQV